MSGFHGLCDAGAALPKSGAELSGALFPQPAIVAKKIIPTTNLKYLDDIFLHRVTYVISGTRSNRKKCRRNEVDVTCRNRRVMHTSENSELYGWSESNRSG